MHSSLRCTVSERVRALSFLVCLTILLGLSVTPILAQSNAGTLTGQVTDQQGAVIPGAQLRVVDPATGSVYQTVSNEAGRYTIPTIPPGDYDITVTKQGFESAKMTKQHVEVGEVLTLNVPMQVGATTTTVEVQATAGAELQTLNATVGVTMRNDALNLMPNLSRDVGTLASLQVGVTLGGNVAGAALDQNKVLLDGGNNSDDMAGGGNSYVPGNGYAGSGSTGGTPTGVLPTPVESIEEFKVGTIGQGADFGSAAGSQVQMVTKRGTNAFHGAAYEYYFANDVGAANLWLSNHTPDAFTGTPNTPLPATHRNRYGGALGGPLSPKPFLGGKWFFFANYEGQQYPFATTTERPSPTATYRAGVILMPNTAGVISPYNINNSPVTVGNVTYPGCGATQSCDPRGLGVNPLVQKIWGTMPLPNDPSFTGGTPGDAYGNSGGFLAPVSIPQSSNFIVGRVDHDFGEKNKFFVSYRDYSLHLLTTNQTDMSGLLGGASGTYTATAPRAVKPDYWVTGLTTSISPNMTNDLHFSYIRNFWQWFTDAGTPQFSNLGGAVELGGESVNALIPYNVNTQSTRQRFWDGHDYFLVDNISHLHGNHLFQYGGDYQRNNDLHSRNDNGVTIDTSTTYLSGGTALGGGIAASAYQAILPPSVNSGALTNFGGLFAQATGILEQTQLAYTRSGALLNLNPPGQFAFDQSIVPSYDAFFNDTWHVKPHVTLSFGLAYNLTMPPFELNGKQVQMVDQADNPINIKSYLTERMQAALQGQVFEPTIGFATIRNVQGGESKYPYNPFYGGFSPHVSLAWNPNFGDNFMGKIFGHNNTVIRGGYGRIYGRLNGVDLLLVPLLGPGLIQGVACVGPLINGTCSGAGGSTPATAFRIGVDGNTAPLPSATATLPQPFFPGTLQNGVVNAGAADGSQLDPNFKPNHSDEVTLTIQRSLSPKLLMEVGYIGRKISNEFQEINIDAVPWMTTVNGQSFAQAYANVYSEYCGLQGANASGTTCLKNSAAVTNQPFFEAALGGANSSYCAALNSCTKTVVANEGGNFSTTAVNAMWLDLGKASSWTLGRSMLEQSLGTGLNQQLTGAFDFINSYGHGSYNALFFTFKSTNWHGITTQSNFTWGRALGTGSVVQASSSITVPNPFDFNNFGTYGVQPFDSKFTYTLLMLYQPPWYQNQRGFLGHVLGGWSIAPLFTARSGFPQQISNGGNAQGFGEIYSGQSANFEEAAGVSPFTGGYAGEGYYNFQNGVASGPGSAGNPAAKNPGSGINLFNNPVQVASEFRPLVLGVDSGTGGAGVIRGFPFWNLDATISKDFRIIERVGATLVFQSVNTLNHFVPNNPTTNIQNTASFGVVTNQFTTGNGIQSRWMEFGLRLRF